MRKTIGFLIVFLGIAILYLHPVGDTDVFWHIKTGELTLKTLSIPGQDNFSFTTYENLKDSEVPRLHFILKQYWLSQPIFFLIWKLGGIPGLAIFRAAIFLLILLLILNYLKKRNLSFTIQVSLLLLAGIHLARYSTDRPQIFSFFFTACYIHEMESLIAGQKRPLFTLPLINLLWANMHSSALMGIFIASVYLVSMLPVFLKKNSGYNGKNYLQAGIIFFSILISLLNPNNYQVFPLMSEQLFQKPLHFYYNTEYMSPIERLKELKELNPEYWLFVIITTVCLLSNEMSGLHRSLLICLMLFSLTAIRFSPFFIIASAMFSAKPLESLLKKFRGSVMEVFRGFLLSLSIGLFLVTAFIHRDELLSLKMKDIYPEQALNFISHYILPGVEYPSKNIRLLNYFEWGGYIIWKEPKLKVFIDGRVLRLSVWEDYFKTVLKPDHQWQERLMRYDVNLILLPPVTTDTGMPLNLLYLIIGAPNWKVIYADEDSIILTKKEEPFREVPVDTVKELILQKLMLWLEVEPDNPVRWRNLKNACSVFENKYFRSSACRSLSP